MSDDHGAGRETSLWQHRRSTPNPDTRQRERHPQHHDHRPGHREQQTAPPRRAVLQPASVGRGARGGRLAALQGRWPDARTEGSSGYGVHSSSLIAVATCPTVVFSIFSSTIRSILRPIVSAANTPNGLVLRQVSTGLTFLVRLRSSWPVRRVTWYAAIGHPSIRSAPRAVPVPWAVNRLPGVSPSVRPPAFAACSPDSSSCRT